jgi:CheY-like chemotaxis protein
MMEAANRPILLVDDNEDDELLTLDALRTGGVSQEIVVVRDGLEAIEWLFGEGSHVGRDTRMMPQLILLDLKLPKIDGFEVLASMRRDERTRYIPTVVLSSSTQRDDILNSYARGANSYVRKAVDFEEYSCAVRCLCEYWLQHNQA